MNISSEQIKTLREKTGAGMLNCKTALIETKGDFDKAVEFLRQKGLASAEKKLSRTTKQGIITSYIHTGAKIGVLIELNCETDFVARRIEFQTLAKNLAMQIVASNVSFISLKDIPQEMWDSEIRIESEREDVKTKPEKIRESIIKGRVEKTLKTYTLLNQSCIRDPEIIVEEYIKNHVSLLGENIQIGRFTKFVIGENN
uniref:Elongation factor Ts, mitochondrial n=1 Tax=Mallomonas splendens TaxID=52552 RepID=A0A3G2QZC3_9STRA|nr:elongation factor Ts [Mallomonas splendens]AYO28490.1 elongation factor Ts [Mallomonas splendens]